MIQKQYMACNIAKITEKGGKLELQTEGPGIG
jgi:hypothetical protein